MATSSSLSSTYGALFLAAFASAVLFGVASLQAYLYYHLYPQDLPIHRVSVGAVWFLDGFSTCLLIHALYHYLIDGFGDALALQSVVWSLSLHSTISIILRPMVQSLYGLRTWKQRGDGKILPLFVALTLSSAWVTSIIIARDIWRFISPLEIIRISKVTIFINLSSSALVDIFNTFTMCHALYKPDQTFTLTKSLVRNLILWIFGTGMLTCCFNIAVIAIFAAMPNNLIFLSIAFVVTKLYTNGFLVTLNVRKSLGHSASGQVMMLPTLNSPLRTSAPIAVQITPQKISSSAGISWATDLESLPSRDAAEADPK